MEGAKCSERDVGWGEEKAGKRHLEGEGVEKNLKKEKVEYNK